MEYITSLLNNPAFTLLVNTQVFAAVLLALLVYRFVAPLIDFLNPFFFLIGVAYRIKDALLRNSHSTGAASYQRGNGGALKSTN